MSGIVERVILDTQMTVTTNWYTEQYLSEVIESPKSLGPNSRMASSFFHRDFLTTIRLKSLEQFPYNSNIGSCTFALFPHVKLKMKERQFFSDEDLLRAWENF